MISQFAISKKCILLQIPQFVISNRRSCRIGFSIYVPGEPDTICDRFNLLDITRNHYCREQSLRSQFATREGEPIVSVNPARPQEVVGTVYGITRELADHAVSVARDALKSWSQRPPEDRAKVLFRAADAARRRRVELAAWL